MKRRHVLLAAAATGASAAALGAGWRVFGLEAGQSGRAGAPVRLASVSVLNIDDRPHEVTVSVSRDGETLAERTVDVDPESASSLTDGLPARAGRYRVRATLGGETIAASPGDSRAHDCLDVVATVERDGSLGTMLVSPDDAACHGTTE